MKRYITTTIIYRGSAHARKKAEETLTERTGLLGLSGLPGVLAARLSRLSTYGPGVLESNGHKMRFWQDGTEELCRKDTLLPQSVPLLPEPSDSNRTGKREEVKRTHDRTACQAFTNVCDAFVHDCALSSDGKSPPKPYVMQCALKSGMHG